MIYSGSSSFKMPKSKTPKVKECRAHAVHLQGLEISQQSCSSLRQCAFSSSKRINFFRAISFLLFVQLPEISTFELPLFNIPGCVKTGFFLWIEDKNGCVLEGRQQCSIIEYDIHKRHTHEHRIRVMNPQRVLWPVLWLEEDVNSFNYCSGGLPVRVWLSPKSVLAKNIWVSKSQKKSG